eukprot:m.121453 g.121453  ORF g.121453 m.121453 type:complete len:750 (+) comp52094_c0_seq10:34-2283(+)
MSLRAPSGHVYRDVRLDGNLTDVVQSMTELKHNADVMDWGCRSLMDLATADARNISRIWEERGHERVLEGLVQFSANTTIICSALACITALIDQEDMLAYFLDGNLLEHLASAMQTQQEHVLLCKICCNLLTKLFLKKQDIWEQVVSLEIIVSVVHCLRAFLDEAMQIAACETLLQANVNENMRVHIIRERGAVVVVQTLSNHTKANDVMFIALEVIQSLTRDDVTKNKLAEIGIVPLVLGCLGRSSSSPRVVQAATHVIARLAQLESNRVLLCEHQAETLITHSMVQHTPDADIQLYSCWALLELVASDPADEKGDPENDIILAILKSLKRHRKNADVNRYGTKALENLASRSEANRIAIAQADGVHLIVIGMREHAGNPQVQGNALHALAVVAKTDDKMHIHIAQLDVVAHCVRVMASLASSPDVQHNACRLLANIALNGKVRELIVKEKALAAIYAAIKNLAADCNVQHYAFWAMTNIALSDDTRQTLIDWGLRTMAIKGLRSFPDDVDVAISAFRLLARLAFNKNNFVDVVAPSIVAVLETLKRLQEEPDAFAVGCAALAAFADNSKNKVQIVHDGGLRVLEVALGSFLAHEHIQQHALTCVGLLALKCDTNKTKIGRLGFIPFIVESMKAHSASSQVVYAGCGALRNLTSQHEENRRQTFKVGGLGVLMSALQSYYSNETLAYWAMAAIVNLSRDAMILDILANSRDMEAICTCILGQFSDKSRAFIATKELQSKMPSGKKTIR